MPPKNFKMPDIKINVEKGAYSGKKAGKNTVTVTKTTYRKSRNKKIMKSSQPAMSGPKASPFRVKKYIAMQYNRSTQLCSSGTNVNRLGAVFMYNLNNLNKPYSAQITNDPLPYGFSDVSSDWKSFKVHGVYVKLQLPPNVVGKHMKLVVSFVNSSGGGTPLVLGTDYEQYVGLPNVFVQTLDMDNPTVFTKKISIARLEGLTKDQYKNNVDVKYIGNYQKNSAIVVDDPKSAILMYIGLINTFDNTAQCYEKDLQITYYTENLNSKTNAKETST